MGGRGAVVPSPPAEAAQPALCTQHHTGARAALARPRPPACACTPQVLKRLASETSGLFGVAASPQHLRQFVLQLVTPRPSEQANPNPNPG